jgi:hypothetical protein
MMLQIMNVSARLLSSFVMPNVGKLFSSYFSKIAKTVCCLFLEEYLCDLAPTSTYTWEFYTYDLFCPILANPKKGTASTTSPESTKLEALTSFHNFNSNITNSQPTKQA